MMKELHVVDIDCRTAQLHGRVLKESQDDQKQFGKGEEKSWMEVIE